MSGDDRELYADEWNKGCQRQIIFWIVVLLTTHSVAFIFGIWAAKLLYG